MSKVALVTGGTRGIGAAISIALKIMAAKLQQLMDQIQMLQMLLPRQMELKYFNGMLLMQLHAKQE